MNKQLLIILSVLFISSVSARQWFDAGAVRWAFNCDFYGNDLKRVSSPPEKCGPSTFEGGTCFMKQGPTAEGKEISTGDGYICGYLPSRVGGGGGGGVGGVKGTYWAETSDAGGCQMPQFDYAVTDAIALGQSQALGNLKWRQGLCGQVLRIDCGNGAVDAVVASTCNLNSDSCGVDMIGKTWRRATANKPPGEVSCSVALTNTNRNIGCP